MTTPVNVFTFAQDMTQHWVSLGNVESQPLRDSWMQNAVELNRMIADFGTPAGTSWRVVSPPTGSGKTESLKLYCAALSRAYPTNFGHPGVLIVTRLQEDAKLIAEDINRHSGRTVAAYSHSGHRLPAEEAARFPVLVLCHAAFQLALTALSTGDPYAGSWAAFMRWDGEGQRRLVVVDEAINLISESTLKLDDLRMVEGMLTQPIREAHPEAVQAVVAVRSILERFVSQAKGNAEVIIHDGKSPLPSLTQVNLGPLRVAMKSLPYSRIMGHTVNTEWTRSTASRVDEVLREVSSFVDSWVIATRAGNDRSLSTGRLLTPEDGRGAVVLDATASCNMFYGIFPRAKVINPPQQVRTYSNVRLHLTQDIPTGKHTLTNRADTRDRVAALMGDISERLKGRKVLLICHKDIEYLFQQYSPPFASYQVAHWGRVTGTNQYRDCDAVVLYGLPWRPESIDLLTYFAVQGVQPEEWLRDPELRQWPGFGDIRKSIRMGALAVDVVQAINRASCRKVIDAKGNCPVTDVYMALPRNADDAGRLVGNITTQMPGIVQSHWDVKLESTVRARRSGYEASLVSWLKEQGVGSRIGQTWLAKELCIPHASMKRIAEKLREDQSPLRLELAGIGVRYTVTREGKCSRAYFERVADKNKESPKCPSDATASIAMN